MTRISGKIEATLRESDCNVSVQFAGTAGALIAFVIQIVKSAFEKVDPNVYRKFLGRLVEEEMAEMVAERGEEDGEQQEDADED